ncbi:hypothetical protein Tco_0540295 [Tanacetum coccineum]
MKKRLARKKKMESLSKQGRKTFKSVPTMYKDPGFDDLDDAMDYMETEDARDEGTVKDTEKKFKMLANDEEIARKVQEEYLAKKPQEEEREKFTIEQRAKFLHDTIVAQRRCNISYFQVIRRVGLKFTSVKARKFKVKVSLGFRVLEVL